MSNETIAWKICYTDKGRYRTVLSEHNSVGDYRAIDPMASSIALCATPVSAEPVAHAMEAIMGYRLEFKPGEYCYYTPEGYALEAYKGDAPAHALYANPQPGCPSEIEVYKGWCWVRPKYNFGNIVDETFRPLFLGPQLGAPVAAQAPVFSVGVRGVGLIDDNPSALAIYFYAAPNNDDIRALHEVVSGTPVAAQAQPTRRELDMAMLIKNLARQVRRAEPYGTNYHRISDDALDALKRWGLDGSPVRTTKPEGTQSQQVDKSTEMQRQLVDRTPDLHRQQQPESSADQFRDAAQMIEPSGNSGGLPVSVRDALDWYAQQVGNCRRFGTAGDAARADLDADGGRRARAALAQQDADKEDAERYRYLRGYRGHKATGVLLKGVLFNGHESLARTDEAIDAARKEQA